MNYEREYFTIEQHNYGKMLHYMGFSNYSGECPDDWDEEEWRKTDMGSVDFTYPTWVMLPVDNVDVETLNDIVDTSSQYMERLIESDAVNRINNYYDDTPGTHLPMWQVNSDTPCGCYWCYTDEMTNE